MKQTHALMMMTMAVGIGLGAHAQRAPAAEPRLWLGGNLGVSPIGTIKVGVGDQTASGDASAAVGVSGFIEYRVTPLFSIGFAPNILLHVQADGADDSATALDLPIRLSIGGDVAPRIRVYGFASPGYSILYPPNNQGDSTHPSGFMIGFGGGAAIRVAPQVQVTGELGYQFRFLSTTQQGIDLSFQANYLTLSAGIAVAVD
jgi:hypothetical protein